jgi:hypothetical protein
MDAAKVDVGRDLPDFHGAQEMFRACLDEGPIEDFGERLVLRRDAPAALGLAVLELDNLLEDVLPSPGGCLGVGGHQVGAAIWRFTKGTAWASLRPWSRRAASALFLVPRDC